MAEPKRICLVIPSLQIGGMERVMSELATYFCNQANFKVDLIMYGINPELFYEIPESLTVYQPIEPFNNIFRVISTLKRAIFLRRTIKFINPHVILSFGELWNSFVLLSLLGLNFPVFISDRCSPARSYKPHSRLLRRVLYPLASGVIAQTVKAKELYASQFRNNNVQVIGNPIRPCPLNLIIEKKNVVLSVGRLIDTKHHDKLIMTFANINKPDWTLVIVGDDSLKQANSLRLKKLVADLNMDDRIVLAGKQQNVDQFYLSSRIFAFASSSEGFPNVIGEAMSAALPVIAFDCVAGPADMIINNHNGFLISLFDWADYQKKLTLLMEDKDLRLHMGDNGKKDIQKYSLDVIGNKYREFLLN